MKLRALRILPGPATRRQIYGRAPWALVTLFLVFMIYIIADTGGLGTEAVVLMSGFVILLGSLRRQVRRG